MLYSNASDFCPLPRLVVNFWMIVTYLATLFNNNTSSSVYNFGWLKVPLKSSVIYKIVRQEMGHCNTLKER